MIQSENLTKTACTIKKGVQYSTQPHAHIQPKNKKKGILHVTSLINLYNLTFVILTCFLPTLFSACTEDFSRLLCKVSSTMVISNYSQQENKGNQVVQNSVSVPNFLKFPVNRAEGNDWRREWIRKLNVMRRASLERSINHLVCSSTAVKLLSAVSISGLMHVIGPSQCHLFLTSVLSTKCPLGLNSISKEPNCRVLNYLPSRPN